MAPVNLSLANRLLAALPAQERNQCLAQSELVELKPQTVVLAAGQVMEHVWFPVEGFVSLMLAVDHGQMEVGLVGSEGMFNVSLVLGGKTSAFSCRVLGSGRAFRLHASALQAQLGASSRLRQLLRGYADVRHRQVAQQAACLKHHSVEQRLARWLLMTRDRAHASELFLTHETLALMLGARRESVTQAARRFQLRGYISYSRGYMMLLDEAALQAAACTCYAHDLASYDNWWADVAPAEVTNSSMNCSLATTCRASTKG